MQAIELETRIDETGHICVPEKFHNTYGKHARLVVLISDQLEAPGKKRRPGSAKGLLSLVSEDDEHPNDFKEYMP